MYVNFIYMTSIELKFKKHSRLKMVGSRFDDIEYSVIKKLSLQKKESVSETVHVLVVAALRELGLLK